MSHVTTLINRVKNLEKRKKLRSEEYLNRIVNIVEYITFHTDCTEDEKVEALKILEKYKLSYMIDNKEAIDQIYSNILTGKDGALHRSCIRCSKPLKNPKSVKLGMGKTCYDKVGQNEWGTSPKKYLRKLTLNR